MTQAKWEFVGGVSFVVFLTALAIHGLVDGRPIPVVVGVGALAAVFLIEVASRRGWVRTLLAGTWPRRILSVCFGVFVFSSTVGCVVAIDNGDWGSFLYNAVTGAASIGALFFFAYTPQLG